MLDTDPYVKSFSIYWTGLLQFIHFMYKDCLLIFSRSLVHFYAARCWIQPAKIILKIEPLHPTRPSQICTKRPGSCSTSYGRKTFPLCIGPRSFSDKLLFKLQKCHDDFFLGGGNKYILSLEAKEMDLIIHLINTNINTK